MRCEEPPMDAAEFAGGPPRIYKRGASSSAGSGAGSGLF